MKTIPLTRGKVALIDDEDYAEVSKHKWLAQYRKTRNIFYALRFIKNPTGKPRQKTLYLHRAIMQPHPKMQVDHINGDPLDNRRANLRVCTASQNRRNSKRKYSKGRTIYKGIYGKVCGDKIWWEAKVYITQKGKQKSISLGVRREEREAAELYDEGARKYYGEFACLNFPGEGEQGCLEELHYV